MAKKRKSYAEFMKENYGVTNDYVEQVNAIKASKVEDNEDIAPVKTPEKKVEEEKGNFLGWLGDTAMTGLAQFNKSITSTADLLLGKPLQALGWENNPISSVAEYYAKDYDRYKEKSSEETSKMGGGGWNVAEEIVSSTVSAAPDAVMALITMGSSLVPSATTLMTQAAKSTGNLLTKAGLTASSMAKNPQYWLSFARTYGTDYEEAIESGASETVAAFTSTITSLVNAGIEIGIAGGSGFQGLPDKIKGGDKKAIMSWVESALEEGGEEVLQGFVNDAVAKVSYDPNREVLNSKEMIKEFGVGAAVGGILGGGQIAVQSGINTAANAIQKAESAKLTEGEKAVVNKAYENAVAEKEQDGKKLTQKEKAKIYDDVLEQMEKGYISTDTIEEVLGGESYNAYKSAIDKENSLQSEFDTLNQMKQGEMTGEQLDRRAELKQQLSELKEKSNTAEMKTKLGDEVYSLIKDSKLAESYNEKSRRGQAFEADLSQYEEKYQGTIKKAIESGILNNTRRTHEMVDFVAKISADKGVLFDFTNNEKIKNSSFAVDGKTVNGFVDENGNIVLNINSAKSLNSTAGHEITHILEGTELYQPLSDIITEYAKTKGEYDSRLEALNKLYEGVYKGEDFAEKVNKELVADLVGDYIFTDKAFVQKLSTENRNVFQKIYDEIKYLCKVATAGSKEARELEKVRKTFAEVYRESGTVQKNTAEDSGVRYSISKTKNMDWNEQINDLYNKQGLLRRSDTLVIENSTPAYLQSDVIENLPLVIPLRVVTKASNGKDISHSIKQENIEDLQRGIRNADIIIKNPDRNSFVFVTDIKQDGYPVLVSFLQNTEFDGDRVHKATSIHLQIDVTSMLESLPDTATVYFKNKKELNNAVGVTNNLRSLAANVEFIDKIVSQKNKNVKQKQLEIILETNPAYSDSFTWIRKVEDIHTLEETLSLSDWKDYDEFDPDLTKSDILKAIESGEITVYSSHPIENGAFVTPSRMEAETYAGTGEVYQKTVDINDVAWIDPTQGQLAKINGNTNDLAPVKYSLSESETIDNYTEEQYNNFGWITNNNLVSAQERETLFSRYADYKHNRDKYPTTRFGEAVIHSTECPDVIMYVKGEIGEPNITKVVRINADVMQVKEVLLRYERERYSQPFKLIENYFGEWILDINHKRDYESFREVKARIERERSQASNTDSGTGQDRAGSIQQNSQADRADLKRSAFSLSEQGKSPTEYGNFNIYGEDVKLETEPTEDIAPVMDNTPITEEEAIAEARENLESLEDMDAPPEVDAPYTEYSDTTRLDETTLKNISKSLNDVLYLNRKESQAIREVIQKYSTSEMPDKTDLFWEIKEQFGEKYYDELRENIAEVKAELKKYKIKVPQTDKGDYGDYNAFRRNLFNKLTLSTKEGIGADVAYKELAEEYPDFFPEDIWSSQDRLLRMAQVANMSSKELMSYEIDDETIQEAVNIISDEVRSSKEVSARIEAEDMARESLKDIAPLRAEQIVGNANGQDFAPSESNNSVEYREAKKLHGLEKELADNKQLRTEAISDYSNRISRLADEYKALKDKNSRRANDIVRQITRLERLKANVDTDYSNRINRLEARVDEAKRNVKTTTAPDTESRPKTRKQLHNKIIDNIKFVFSGKGFDFDEVLKKAKNLSTLSTVDNTPQRVMEKALGYKEGQALADLTVNKVAQNETEGIKWLNSFTDRKNGLLAQLSKRYDIKPGSKESAAAQMYAEGFYVNKNNDIIAYGDAELAKDFPDVKVRNNIKGLASDPRIRQIYDETLNAINESRARNAYPEIQRLDNYFLHFRAMDDTFSRLGLPFNPNDIRAKDLPTDLNGVTADLKPGQPYFSSANHRTGKRTSFDLLGGLERYLTSAKNQIYHIDDIQTLRALRNYIADNYGQANGLEGIDALTEEEAQERIDQVYNSHLSTFAKFLNEEANVIAGKTTLIDRGLEGVIGRRGTAFMDSVRKQVGSNMIGFNVSSSLTNIIAGVQAIAKTNKAACIKSLAQTTASRVGSIFGKTDSFVENNPTIIRRKGAERFHRTPFQKAGDAGYVLMSAVDNITTEFIVRAKYNEFIKKGMSEQQAITEADKWTSRLMGDRSLGQMPQLYNSKTLGLITQFQLEVRNQLDSQFYDTVQEAKASNEEIQNGIEKNAKTAAKVAKTFFELAVLQHLFGAGFEAVAGYNPAFDIIGVLATALGFDDDEESGDAALDNIEQGFLELLEDLPYTSLITNGGRIPMSSALPIKELVTGKDEYGNEKSRWDTLKETAPYYILPTGYGQIKKTTQGLGMFNTDEEHPIAGSYTDSGALRFPVEDTLGNRIQAGVFGQYANENAREYFNNDYAPLKEKQIKEYDDVDLPISDYWKYREELKGLKTNAEKADYINSLNIADWQKNLLMNNILDRKEDVDMSNYDDFGSWEEFDFACKYPENYAVAKAVGGYESYKTYTSALYDIKADKDRSGKTISGSRKKKVTDYINSLNIDYYEKIILFKNEYNSDNTYNYEIVEHLNNREDISYEEMEAILKKLGFTVTSDGTIRW